MKIITGSGDYESADYEDRDNEGGDCEGGRDNKGGRAAAVAIGKFDGIHLGHRALLDSLLSYRSRGMKTVVFTFDRPFSEYFTGQRASVLTTNSERREYLRDYGVDLLCEFPLNADTVSMEAEDFISEVLVSKLKAGAVIGGTDLSFGRGALGNMALLKEKAGKYGYEAVEIDKVEYGGAEISSSRVRACVEEGDMETVSDMLGRPYSVKGVVSHGTHIGTDKLSVPTINLIPPAEKLLPPYGVYFCYVLYGGVRYRAMANIGVKPTVSRENKPGIEAHIFDFDKDVYGSAVEIQLLRHHRKEMRFDSLGELKKQVHDDMLKGICFFSRFSS